ncbi:OpcA/G6PD domain-containing protein, partial [Arthrobacter pascens]|nr:glucose-6-phosphate dehydrogenase assembly protein OpcA [Arthrobacter pascens]
QLFRPGLSIAELTQPGQPAQRISLPRRSLRDCLAEELRRLDPDEVFGLALGCINAAPFTHSFG